MAKSAQSRKVNLSGVNRLARYSDVHYLYFVSTVLASLYSSVLRSMEISKSDLVSEKRSNIT